MAIPPFGSPPTPDATTSKKGKVELATNAEAQAGTDTERAVTPSALNSVGYLQNIVEDTTPQLGGELDAQGNNIIDLGDVTFKTGATGGTLRTGTSAADKFELQAYDVDGGFYQKVLEVDAGNDPQLEVFADSFAIWDNADETKQLFFTLSGGATGVTTEFIHSPTANRQITFPNATGTLALTSDLVTDHGGLTGLSDDDHTQYGLLAGRATPQTFAFGTASGATGGYLTSTAHATKGSYSLDAAGNILVDEANTRLGINQSSPTSTLDVNGTITIGDSSGNVPTMLGFTSGFAINFSTVQFLPKGGNTVMSAIFGPSGTQDKAFFQMNNSNDLSNRGRALFIIDGASAGFAVDTVGTATSPTAIKIGEPSLIGVGAVGNLTDILFSFNKTDTHTIKSTQWGINTTSPTTSAALDISGTAGALLLPRLTTTQRDALTATNGMLIYNTTNGVLEAYESGSWVNI